MPASAGASLLTRSLWIGVSAFFLPRPEDAWPSVSWPPRRDLYLRRHFICQPCLSPHRDNYNLLRERKEMKFPLTSCSSNGALVFSFFPPPPSPQTLKHVRFVCKSAFITSRSCRARSEKSRGVQVNTKRQTEPLPCWYRFSSVLHNRWCVCINCIYGEKKRRKSSFQRLSTLLCLPPRWYERYGRGHKKWKKTIFFPSFQFKN